MPVNPDALDAAVRRIGDRWSLRIIGALLEGERTFGDLAAVVDGIAPTILTTRLRTLQARSLVVATPYARRPVRMRYALTESGRRLGAVVATLAEWGAAREGDPDRPVHRTCGTPVETRPWCPTCDRPVDEETDDDLVWC